MVPGLGPIAYVECYDPDSNEWYDASPMNLNRSALGACVIAGLVNAKDYSYVSKASRNLGQGSSRNRGKSNHPELTEGRYYEDNENDSVDREIPQIRGSSHDEEPIQETRCT